jgi:hypothetical protein
MKADTLMEHSRSQREALPNQMIWQPTEVAIIQVIPNDEE